MSNPLFEEIIRRAKYAAEHMGNRIGGTLDVSSPNEKPIWSLPIEIPDASVKIFWLPTHGNMRIRASIHSFGHWGSISVLDLHEQGKPGSKETWHNPPRSVQAHLKPKIHDYCRLRVAIRDALRDMMVLEDLASVNDPERLADV